MLVFKLQEIQMSANNNSETIFIREKTLLPAGLSVESEAFLPGWRAIRDLDGYELSRKLAQAKWSFFYLAGEVRTIVLGRERDETKRRAVRRILGKLKGQGFNCLEITEVVAKRFLGFPVLRVAAHSRHLQESLFLVPIDGLAPGMTAAAAPGTQLVSSDRQHQRKVIPKQDEVLISSS
jgi:hypothetical protein